MLFLIKINSMKHLRLFSMLFVSLFLTVNFLFAQALPGTLNWYNGDGLGMSTNKAYDLLKKKKSSPVIVAVIDSGLDIEHEDLKGKVWVNKGEIPNNKIDDDKNGFVDDVHGWNFLGNASGENQGPARLEKTRILAQLMLKYDGIDPQTIASNPEFDLYLKVKEDVEAALAELEPYRESLDQFDEDTRNYILDQLNYNLNVNYDDRAIQGDNPSDFTDLNYGNPDVEGTDALHGTHVAGIIAAIRGNNLGGDGVADNVLIMPVRAVPNGDEHDKDVALAIRYAVDNGAKVINMSFGKDYSSFPEEVANAIYYAESHDVLLVHAAGNDAKNIDIEPNYPETYNFEGTDVRTGVVHDNYLTVGASTKNKEELVASFSNYGAVGVDVFAPGLEIYNSVPNNAYQNLQGTSMAAPMVTGVAALLKSYFPSLLMSEIRGAILLTVQIPDSGALTDLCNSRGVVNVYSAAKYCMKLEAGKK